MTKEVLIKQTIATLKKLPQDQVSEVNQYADYIFKKYEEKILQSGIENLVLESSSYEFLKQEEDLYTEEDLKTKF